MSKTQVAWLLRRTLLVGRSFHRSFPCLLIFISINKILHYFWTVSRNSKFHNVLTRDFHQCPTHSGILTVLISRLCLHLMPKQNIDTSTKTGFKTGLSCLKKANYYQSQRPWTTTLILSFIKPNLSVLKTNSQQIETF